MTAPASPPVAGVDAEKIILEAVYEGFEHGQCEKFWEPAWGKVIVDRCLRALASPVGGDGSLQAEDRPSVPRGVDLATVAKSLDSIASKISVGSVNPGHAKYVWYAASVIARMAPPAASVSPGMETLQASECTQPQALALIPQAEDQETVK